MIYQFEITYAGVTTIVDEPVGWSDVEFVKRRDETFYGIFFEFSSELRFYAKAYQIIMSAFENDDIEADITVTIKEKKVSWKPFTTLFEGVVLFDNFKYDNTFVTVTLEKTSILRQLKNIIEKPFEVVPNKVIKVHSQPIQFESEFSILDTLTGSSGGGSVIPELTLENSELETTVNQTGAIFYNGDTNTRSIRVHGHINCTTRLLPSNNDRGLKFWIGYKPVEGGIPVFTLVYTDAPSAFSYTHNFDFDTTINVPFDHNILIKFDDDSFDGQFTTFDFLSGSFIKTTETTTSGQNIEINGVTFHEAFNQICNEYLGLNTFTSSALQESDKINNLVTNPYQLRGLNKNITTTFKDLLNAVQVLFNCGLEVVNNQIKISNYTDIFDITSPQTITNHSIPEFNIESKLAFNQIELTYDKFNLSDLPALNGLYEFNTSRQYALDTSKVTGKKSLQPKVITSGTTIERLIRRRNQETSTYQEDNDIVVIALNKIAVTTDIYTGASTTHPVGTVSERNEVLSISNVLDPSLTFNIHLSPRRIISKHLSEYYYIRQSQYKFLTGEGNNDATIATIPESSDIGNPAISYKSPIQTTFETDENVESMYIQVESKNYFITELSTKLNTKSKIVAIQSFL